MKTATITAQVIRFGKQLKYSAPQIVETANKRKHYIKSVLLKSPPLPSFQFLQNLEFSRHPVFLDVGANYGQSAISMRHFVPDCSIRCIEANPNLAEPLFYLSRKLQDIDVLIAAAGDQYSVLDLTIPVLGGVVNTGGASLSAEFVGNRRVLLEDHYGGEMALQSQRVPAIPLDALNSTPSFVKIDVEGEELSVLKGLSKTIKQHKPVVMLETLHSDGQSVTWLLERGYEIRPVLAGGELGSPIAETDRVDQIQDIVGLPSAHAKRLSK